jgi:hypothetical protein
MKKILAIGGAVIKTASDLLYKVIQQDHVEILIHNGGSLFHDFQLALDPPPNNMHSYPMKDLMDSREKLRTATHAINQYLFMGPPPKGSITELCETLDIPVLMFTGLACDWWQFQVHDWSRIALKAKVSFDYLLNRFRNDRFHYVCMGSAVIHPEVFVKALALANVHNETNWFKADVVDFLDMYRPRTRVSQYGHYYKMTHREYLNNLLLLGE